MAGPAKTLSDRERAHESRARSAPHLDLEVECELPLSGPARYRLGAVEKVCFGRAEMRSAKIDGRTLVVEVADGWMSSHHAELVLAESGWILTDLESKNGTLHNGVRIERGQVADGDLLQLGHTFFRFRASLRSIGPDLIDARDLLSKAPGLRTFSPDFADLLRDAPALAASKVPVLLLGESGTGKEVMAQTLHQLSGRKGDFVAVNCGAIPHELLEAELFGHRKGAFSGALADRPGLVRQSDGGTLFLDEIGDLPLPAQAALLRVLQEEQVVPLGFDKSFPVDLRVVAATNRQLGWMVREGKFRQDLLARIDGARFQLPPLRERREDVPLLLSSLLKKLAPANSEVKLAPEAAQMLLAYRWPLNIRELAQVLRSALARAQGRPIEAGDLPALAPAQESPMQALDGEDEHQRSELLALLGKHRGNVAAVARAMGEHRTQVARWMERYGIYPEEFRR
jgi:transcriptional regulator with PAS, ATPase and Fis domain